ncbi:MAG: vWA domain-containing protein [Candidatus Hodarchaeales archaeon]
MKKIATIIIMLFIMTVYISQNLILDVSGLELVDLKTEKSDSIISEDLIIDISQNSSSLGIHSNINFEVDLTNNGSYTIVINTISVNTTSTNIEILSNEANQITSLNRETSQSFNVVISAIDSQPAQSVDLVLIVDVSGSMGEELQSVQTELTELINTLSAEIPDLRIGAIFHGSTRFSEYPTRSESNYLDLTSDFSSVSTLINSFSASGGTEPWGDALYLAKSFSWRPNSQKLIIMVGDEDCDPGDHVGTESSASVYNGSELLSVVTDLKNMGTIISTVVCEGPDQNVANQFQWISRFTGGKSVYLPEMQNGETPISLPSLIQEWTLELSREFSNWFSVSVEWKDFTNTLLTAGAKAHFWVDFAAPSLTHFTKVIPSGKNVFDVYLYAEVVDFSPIGTVVLYHDGIGDLVTASPMEFDNSSSLYFAIIPNLQRGKNVTFFFKYSDILKNSEFSPQYWILVNYQPKIFGEKTIVPVSPEESIFSLLTISTTLSAKLWLSGNSNLSKISVSLRDNDTLSEEYPSTKEFNHHNDLLNHWYRVLEFELSAQTYLVNLTIPSTSPDQLTTLEYTWVVSKSVSTDSVTSNMTDVVKKHLYKWNVSEKLNIFVDYTPASDLVVRGDVYHLNWTYIGSFTVLEALELPSGTYYVMIDSQLRTGEYRVILSEEEPEVTDRYYGASAPGFDYMFGLISLILIGWVLLKVRRKEPRNNK